VSAPLTYVHRPWVTWLLLLCSHQNPTTMVLVSYCYCPPSTESLFRPWPEKRNTFPPNTRQDISCRSLLIMHTCVYLFKRPFLHDLNCPFYYKSYTYWLIWPSCTTVAGTYVGTYVLLLFIALLYFFLYLSACACYVSSLGISIVTPCASRSPQPKYVK